MRDSLAADLDERVYALIRLSDVRRLVIVSGSRCESSHRYGLLTQRGVGLSWFGRVMHVSLTTSVGGRGGNDSCEVGMV